MDGSKGTGGNSSGLGVLRSKYLEVGVVALFLAALTVIAWTGKTVLEQEARERSAGMLRTVLHSSYNAINLWTSSQLRNAEGMASEAGVVANAKALLATPRDKESLLASPAMRALRDLLAPELTAMNYLGFFIISQDYISVGSMRDTNVGIPNLISLYRREILERVFAGESKVIPAITSDVPLRNSYGRPMQRQPTMFVAVPIWDSGEVIAVLTLRIDPVENFSRILDAAQLGSSGETYAFDKDGWLITESRFDEQLRLSGSLVSTEGSMLNIRITDPGGNIVAGYQPKEGRNDQPLTVMAKSATQGHYGVNVQGYRDYRGVRVFGAWGWDEALGFGMTTEIDESEALRSYNVSRSLLLAGYGLTALLAVVMTWYLSRVREAVSRRLEEAHYGLEMRVEERTRDIVAINERMHGEIVERVRTEEKLLQARTELEQANEKLHMLASLDGLTGIANRRIFNETLDREWKRCLRDRNPISLIMLDIDYFKLYNDNYGHQAGDSCLKTVGATLNDLGVARRPGDLVARYGGEEFAVILSNSAAEHAATVAEDIRKTIADLAMAHSASKVEDSSIVTVSLGVASVHPDHGSTPGSLVERADEALYRAKECGRNRFEVYQEEEAGDEPK